MSNDTVIHATELFINMKNVPKWDPKKHYFEQTREALDFWELEKRKITFGVYIGGYFFHPWLYFHINFFRTPVPTKEEGRAKVVDKSRVPQLDDLFLYIIDNYQDAEKFNLGLFLFGTRGSTKSTAIASNTHWTLLTKPDGVHSIMGGSDNDLTAITSLVKHSLSKITDAFQMPTLKADWDQVVTFGIKDKASKDMLHSAVNITNVVGGTSSSSEKGAGLSPVGYIFDEVGKFEFWKTYESALPSFRTQFGYKLVPICAGTGGNALLSKDARKVMEDPAGHEMLLCNWERLERGVPDECITWKSSKTRPFGSFIPGQMSYRLEVPKLKKSFGEFVGNNHPDLKAVEIMVTDWPKATERVKELTSESVKDEASRNRNRMYYPQSTDDCFLTNSENPFPKEVIERHIRKLEERGGTGKDVELHIQDSKQRYELSKKKRSKIRHSGGISDAPIVAHIDPTETIPPEGMFVAGLDGYKIDVSQTDSLGSMYVLKRRNIEPNSPCEVIAASYSARPEKMRYFNQNCEKMLRAWGAKCLIEAVDMGFQQYLDNKGTAGDYLVRSFTLSGHKGADKKLKTTFGIYPTTGNKEYMFNLAVDYTREEHVIGFDEEGNPVIKTGVEFIEDIELLKEMLAYTKGGNFDRIDAFMHALTYARELDKKGYLPKARDEEFDYEMERLSRRDINTQLRSNKYGSMEIRRKLNKF